MVLCSFQRHPVTTLVQITYQMCTLGLRALAMRASRPPDQTCLTSSKIPVQLCHHRRRRHRRHHPLRRPRQRPRRPRHHCPRRRHPRHRRRHPRRRHPHHPRHRPHQCPRRPRHLCPRPRQIPAPPLPSPADRLAASATLTTLECVLIYHAAARLRPPHPSAAPQGLGSNLDKQTTRRGQNAISFKISTPCACIPARLLYYCVLMLVAPAGPSIQFFCVVMCTLLAGTNMYVGSKVYVAQSRHV